MALRRRFSPGLPLSRMDCIYTDYRSRGMISPFQLCYVRLQISKYILDDKERNSANIFWH